jgi:hypothetical protein
MYHITVNVGIKWLFRPFDDSGKHCLLVDKERAIE